MIKTLSEMLSFQTNKEEEEKKILSVNKTLDYKYNFKKICSYTILYLIYTFVYNNITVVNIVYFLILIILIIITPRGSTHCHLLKNWNIF